MKRFLLVLIGMLIALPMFSCNEANVASRNLRQAAEEFQLVRRIVFFNGITDKYLLSITGRCSIESQTKQKQLEVTCKTSETTYKKHHLGMSDNVAWFSEQLEPASVSKYHYKVIFRPSVIIPDIDLK